MKEIPIIDEFEESEFNNCLEEEEIELTFIIDYNEGKVVHNFKDWSFLKKFNKLKVLKLNNVEIKFKDSNNFFSNLYSMEKLEKFIINYKSTILLPQKILPSNLYPKKLKEYEINFDRFDLNKDKSKDYENYEGIGGLNNIEYNWEWLTKWIPQLYDFPNIEKFVNLQTLNFYNIFDTDSSQGHLFEIDNSLFLKKIDIIKSILTKSNIKKINIYGLNLKNKKIYEVEKAKDDKTGKSFTLYESEIFKSITEIYNTKKILFNNEDSLKYLKKYYGKSDLKDITNLAKTSGIPKEVKNYTVGEEGSIQVKYKR